MAIGTGTAILAGAVGSALLGGSASKSAAKAQAASADRAAQLQKEMFEKQTSLQEPFRQAGLTAQQRYMNMLGLQGQAPTARSEAEIRNALSAQYMRPGAGPESGGYYEDVWQGGNDSGEMVKRWVPRVADTVDEAGLSAAVQAEIAKDQAAQQAYQAERQAPGFGKYARDFGMEDFQQDPGYAFRMSEGLKALDRQAAARGGLISGAALKGAQRFGQNEASQEYTNAFNRYQTNRANQLQPLESLMGTSQTVANTLGNAAGNYAQGAGEAYMGAGSARASGYMGGANALTGALNQGLNMYGDQQYLNRMRPQGGGVGAQVGSSVSYLPDDRDIGIGGSWT
jgi:hypothetical protein